MLRWPATIAFILCVTLYLSGLLDSLEWQLIDLRARINNHAVATDLTVVEIDAKSLRALNTWPWSRGYHAQVLDKLRESGVHSVFVDIDFSSSSTPSEDKQLADALGKYERDRILLPVFAQYYGSSQPYRHIVLTEPATMFRKNTSLVSVTLQAERDGLVRRLPELKSGGNESILPAALQLNGMDLLPVEEVFVDFSIDPASFPRLSYSDVLSGDFPRELVENRKVIIGATALELGDQLAVPIYRSIPGSVFQALAYQSMHEGLLREVSRPVTLASLVLLTLMLARPLMRLEWRKGLFLVGSAGTLVFAGSVMAYSDFGLMISVAPVLVLLVLLYGLTLCSKLDQQAWRIMLQHLAFRRTDALMSNIVRNSIEGIMTINGDGTIRNVNPAAESMFGFSQADTVNEKFEKFVPVSKGGKRLSDTMVPADRNSFILETTAVHNDGHTFPIEIAMAPFSFDGEELYTAFIRNISERNAQQAALRHQATHDSLTGLGNRSLLQDHLEQLTANPCPAGKSAAVLMLDLDRFKEINDTLGHHVGDLVLKEISRRLAAAVGNGNILTRFGGDEFAILISECGKQSAIIEVATRLLDCLKQPIDANGMRLAVGSSIGIALYPQNGVTAGTLLQCADVAMYLAKRTQSGYALYDPKLDQNSLQRLTITSDLRAAIDSSQLRMFYQPQVELSTGRVVCVEALLRWHHPKFGVINPVDVMEIAEGTELIRPLTQWTLRAALNELSDLHDRGYSIDVAVNLSARLLHDPLLPELLRECLDEVDIPPDGLLLEITESAIISDPDYALSIVEQINDMGIRLSIDDFGTGYSSLAYLKHLPACELKIDKSFVIDMLASESDTMIVRSTIDLAHNFGMRVVAEGIENEQVWRRLKELDCDLAQGYWIARPMLISELRKWLIRWINTEQTAIA